MEKVRVGTKKATKTAKVEERTLGRKEVERKEAKGQRKVEKEKRELAGRVARQGHIASGCRKGSNRNLYAVDEDENENVEESVEAEDDLQAWCLLEESESEQWQEVINRRNKQRVKKANQSSLSSVESSQTVRSKKVVETKDRWVKVRVTMDTGAAGHVMLETMFPRVKLKRKTSPKKFVAANGEQIKDLGEKKIPFKTNEGIQRCITFRSANVVKPFIWKRRCAGRKESAHPKHSRRNGDKVGCYRQCPRPEARNMTPAHRWRLEWRQKKTERVQARMEIRESST